MELITTFNLILVTSIAISSLVQGSIGVGFLMLATPILATFTDLKTAIIYLLIPAIVINIMSILKEGSFKQAFLKFYKLAIFSLIGSAIGTYILLYSDSEIFKILLVFSILFYLFFNNFNIKFTWIYEKKTFSRVFFGLITGLLGGLTNVMSASLLIYTLESKFTKKETIQAANLCFLSSKIIQIILFSYYGHITNEVLSVSIFSIIITIIFVYFGFKIKDKISQELYNKIIRVVLLIIAFILIFKLIFP
jgi:uncharacterized protein